MAGDFNKILISEQYDTLLATITDLVKDMVKGLDPALALGTANIPTNALRWNSANGYDEIYNGTTWGPKAASYAITITGSAAKWTNGRTITLTGAVTATSASWDGSGNLSIATTYSTIPVDKGGTNITSYTIGDLVYASGATALSKLADVATGNVLLSGGVGAAPAYGKVGLTTHVSGTLAEGNGGTGQSSYTIGDILYASGSATMSKLAGVAAGSVLLSGGVGAAPSYGKVGLTTHVSGVLPAANGGSGQSSYTIGDILYASGAAALSKLASVAAGNVLLSGGVGAAPAYGKVGLTTHVDGVLPAANGGSGQSSYAIGDLLYASASNALSKLAAGTSGYYLKANGAGAAPSWAALPSIPAGITLGTQQTLSGTALDFTSIPSGTKRITIMISGVSTNGTSDLMVQIGDSGGIEASGYLGAGAFTGGGTVTTNFTTGFALAANIAAASVMHGKMVLDLKNASANEWVASAIMTNSDTGQAHYSSGCKSLSATLDRLRLTTVGGANSFDAGTVNISYE